MDKKFNSRQLHTGSVPSTVLVCMICLDTDGKMSPISQYNLEAAYEKLTGHPLWDGGHLKQTLCEQCAQQLRNFSRFREQSLRARFLMMELLEKHKLITIQHIKMIQQANYKLSNNLVATMLGCDPCEPEENSDEGRQDSEETVLGVAVKTERCDDSQWEDEDTQMIIEEKEEFNKEMYESAVFMCTVCCEEFPHEHAYSAHVCMHLHDVHPAAPSAHSAVSRLSVTLATNPGDEARAADAADTTQHSERALVADSGASDDRAPDSDHRTNTGLKSCVVELCDILKYPESAKIKSPPPRLQFHTACEDGQDDQEDEVATTHNESAASVLSETKPGTSGHSSRTRTFTCDVCERVFTRKAVLVGHMREHTGEKPYSCKICSYKFTTKSHLVRHMRTHTGEKPYSCEICCYKCANKGDLVKHMRTHTGEKPYSCKTCSYKFTTQSHLVRHMRTHTGEKPYSCKICCYKCANKGDLVIHMRTHTGEKPYSCKICCYKCANKSHLVTHIRTHTGEKPYSCKICYYKCSDSSSLVQHMRTHTGEKPYSCKICCYKFSRKGLLDKHIMRTHAIRKLNTA